MSAAKKKSRSKKGATRQGTPKKATPKQSDSKQSAATRGASAKVAPTAGSAAKASPSPSAPSSTAASSIAATDGAGIASLGFLSGAAAITIIFLFLLVMNRMPIIQASKQLAAAREASRAGELEEARKKYEPLAESDLHNATPHLELGNVILRQAQAERRFSDEKSAMLQEAIGSFTRAYKADPLNVSVRQGIAAVYMEMRRERINLLDEKADALRDDFKAKIINEIAELGQQAEKLLREAERIDPDNQASTWRLAQLYEENDRRWDAAKKYAGMVYDERYGEKARTQLDELHMELMELATANAANSKPR